MSRLGPYLALRTESQKPLDIKYLRDRLGAETPKWETLPDTWSVSYIQIYEINPFSKHARYDLTLRYHIPWPKSREPRTVRPIIPQISEFRNSAYTSSHSRPWISPQNWWINQKLDNYLITNLSMVLEPWWNKAKRLIDKIYEQPWRTWDHVPFLLL